MALTTCRECGKQVSTDAKTCPHCGTSAPAKKKAKGGIGKWLLIVFAIGLVVVVLPKKDKATTAAAAKPPVQAASVAETKPAVAEVQTGTEKAGEVTDGQRRALESLNKTLERINAVAAKEAEKQRRSWDAQTLEDSKLLKACIEHSVCDVSTYPRLLEGKSRFFVFDALGSAQSEQNIGGREIYYFSVPVDSGRKRAKLQIAFHINTVDSVNVY